MRLLQKIRDQSEVILCIYAGDIERKKVRADFGITYDSDALKMIDDLNEWGIEVTAVVITRYENQPSATIFKNKLERRNIRVYTHPFTKGYPTDIDTIVSEEGYGANEYIPTSKPIIIVTGPGPNSGKLATCLSQIYHEYQRGIQKDLNVKPEDRLVVKYARQAALEAEEKGKGNEEIYCVAAIELANGTIITGKNSPLMHAASALILNAVKHLAHLPDTIHLLPPNIMESISHFKKEVLKGGRVSLDLEETLIALSISAIMNPAAQLAVEKLKELSGCEVHVTHMPTPGDEAGLRKLGVNLTSDPDFSTKRLFGW